MRPYIGGAEYIHNQGRWILALQDASPAELRAMPLVTRRLREVREYRLGERPARKKLDSGVDPKPPGISARALADTPAEFHVTVIPASPFLAIPEVSSENRDYIPIGWLQPPVIPSNKLRFVKDADLWHFGVLTSRMHMSWMSHVGGRLESRFQYSIGIVYNTFPWPEATEFQKAAVRKMAQAVLQARASFPDATLADLYDATVMKAELRHAHRALDVAVDRLYSGSTFASDRDRVEFLFGRYEELLSASSPLPNPARRRRAG